MMRQGIVQLDLLIVNYYQLFVLKSGKGEIDKKVVFTKPNQTPTCMLNQLGAFLYINNHYKCQLINTNTILSVLLQ